MQAYKPGRKSSRQWKKPKIIPSTITVKAQHFEVEKAYGIDSNKADKREKGP